MINIIMPLSMTMRHLFKVVEIITDIKLIDNIMIIGYCYYMLQGLCMCCVGT